MSSWKGKARALPRDDSGGGGTGGVVIPLDVVGSGVYDVAYTVPVHVGQNAQSFSLQVDTGSSDLWVASNSCSSSSCGRTGGRSYDPSASATETGVQFNITYLSGQVLGPVVWDRVDVGGYSIENQALAAATSVDDEPLAPNFSGILGLALPLNSIIAGDIPPVTNNSPDGAAWASNLFSITPLESAPAAHFLSLTLSRPGSDRIPSLLGIGKHPPQIVGDPSKIHYSSVVADRSGSLFWKAGVRAITVYVDGQARSVEIGRSNTGAVFPSAVIDSGVPLILTTSAVANGIYGAIDVHPAEDGSYYVPCRTPLNMTITLDDRPELPLHPLDLTGEPPKDNNAEFCIGLIQTADAQLAHPGFSTGDMILGVPFMRNMYTVMAYTVPGPDGSFTPINSSLDSDMPPLRPRLGLMSLTDPANALDEFNRVRVLNEPLSSGDGNGGLSNSSSQNQGKKLSVGIIVLISLIGFFVLCCVLFFSRWLIYQRRYKKQQARDRQEELSDDKRALAYQLARGSVELAGMPNEDTLRAMRYEAYVKKERAMSYSSRRVSDPDEFGSRGSEWNEGTLVGGGASHHNTRPSRSRSTLNSSHSRGGSSSQRFPHQRTASEMPDGHQRNASVSIPLLPTPHHPPFQDHHDDHPYDDIHRRED